MPLTLKPHHYLRINYSYYGVLVYPTQKLSIKKKILKHIFYYWTRIKKKQYYRITFSLHVEHILYWWSTNVTATSVADTSNNFLYIMGKNGHCNFFANYLFDTSQKDICTSIILSNLLGFSTPVPQVQCKSPKLWILWSF